MSTIEVGCPHCGEELEADSSLAGTFVECPSCFLKFKIPKRGKSNSGHGSRSASRASGSPKKGNARRKSGATRKRTRSNSEPPSSANIGDLWTNPAGCLCLIITLVIGVVLMKVFGFEFKNKAVYGVIALGIYGLVSAISSNKKGK